MAQRRADGALEAAVLGILWGADDALTPAQVSERLGEPLAYTTVMTVLVRLTRKGLAERFERGRAFAYRPTVSESELTAQRMGQALSGVRDRPAALAGFVGTLSDEDVEVLRGLLGKAEESRCGAAPEPAGGPG